MTNKMQKISYQITSFTQDLVMPMPQGMALIT